MKQIKPSLHQDVAEIFFPVEKIACNELFSGFTFVHDKEQAIYLPEKKKIVHLCSDGYQLVSNENLISPIYQELLNEYGNSGVGVRILNFDDRKFYTSFMLITMEEMIARGDRIIPSLEIRNSYDGSMKFSLSLGFWRNQTETPLMGFSHPLTREKKHSHKYHPGLGKQRLENLESAVLEESEKFRQMARYPLSVGDISRIAERIRKQTEYPRRLLNDGPLAMYREAQRQNSEPNLWLFYNGFNQVLYQADIQMHREFRERIDQQIGKIISRELGRI